MTMTERHPLSGEVPTTEPDQESRDSFRIQTNGLALARTALESDWGSGRTKFAQDLLTGTAAIRAAENRHRSEEGKELLPEIVYDSQGDAS